MNTSHRPPRKPRLIEELVGEVCEVGGISLQSFSADWIYRFEREGRSAFLFGYDFDLNSATAKTIARDKAATTELLCAANVPCIPHMLLHHPDLGEYIPAEGNWTALLEYFERSNCDVVCKSNEGSSGIDVYRARSKRELESAVATLFARRCSCAVSPYVEIDREVRVFVLRGEVQLAYEKGREVIQGDGRQSVQELLAGRLTQRPDLVGNLRGLATAFNEEALQNVPAKGTEVLLNWKHNLGQGSAARILTDSDPSLGDLRRLACRGADAIGLCVGAVDIVECDGKLSILEVNSGVMMESFGRESAEARTIARTFYAKILSASLE